MEAEAGRRQQDRREAGTVVDDSQRQLPVCAGHVDVERVGATMLDGVPQRLLGHAKYAHGDVVGYALLETARTKRDLQRMLIGDLATQRPERGNQSEQLEPGRMKLVREVVNAAGDVLNVGTDVVDRGEDGRPGMLVGRHRELRGDRDESLPISSCRSRAMRLRSLSCAATSLAANPRAGEWAADTSLVNSPAAIRNNAAPVVP
jgi:hypothetical protein